MKILTSVLALILLAGPAFAADGAAGKVTLTKGEVSLYQSGRSTATSLKDGDMLFPGDEIETGKNSSLSVVFSDESTLSIGANGKLTVEQYQFEGKKARNVRLNTTNAAFEWLGAKNGGKNTEIATDNGTIKVGGAHLIRGVKDGQTTLYVQDGTATVNTSGGKTEVTAGNGTTIAALGAKPADAAPMTAEQIAWIRAELPAPRTPWEAVAPVAAQPDPTCCAGQEAAPVPTQPAAPMELPPVSAPVEAIPAPPAAATEAPAAVVVPAPADMPTAAPVVTPAPIPMPTPMPAPAPEAIPAPQ